jgi:hypothetical protein
VAGPVSEPESAEEDIYADLVGVAEVADGLGVGLYRVKRWIERREHVGCPNPVRTLRLGNVYSMQEWRGWFALWRVTRGSETWNKKDTPET